MNIKCAAGVFLANAVLMLWGAEDYKLSGGKWQSSPSVRVFSGEKGTLKIQCKAKYSEGRLLPVNIKAAEYNRLNICVRSNKPGKLHIVGYFSRKDASGLSEKRRFDGNFVLKTGWNDCQINMGTASGWEKEISGIRLDFDLDQPQNLEFSRLDFSFAGAEDIKSFALPGKGWRRTENCEVVKNTVDSLVFKVNSNYASSYLNGLQIVAADYNRIRFQVKSSREFPMDTVVYYSRKDAPGFAEARKIYTRRDVDGKFSEAILDLAGNKEWKGVITGIRLDIGNCPPGTQVEFCNLEFCRSDSLPPWAPGSGMSAFKNIGEGFSFRLNSDDVSTAWQKVDINAGEYPYLRLKLRGDAVFTGGVNVYFTREDSPAPGGGKVIYPQFFSVSPESCYVYLNMRESSQYKGNITGLRLDFRGVPGNAYTIEEVSFQKEFDLLVLYPRNRLQLESLGEYELRGTGKTILRFYDEEKRELPALTREVALPVRITKPDGAVLMAVDENVSAVVRYGYCSKWRSNWIAHPEFADKGGLSFVGKRFLLNKPLSGKIQMSADDQYNLRINGKFVCHRGYWGFPLVMDVTSFLKDGENEIEVECANDGGPGGVLFHGYFKQADGNAVELLSDGSWICGKRSGQWDMPVKVLGKVPLMPWGDLPFTDLSSVEQVQEEPVVIAGRQRFDRSEAPEKNKYSKCTRNNQTMFLVNGKPLFFNAFKGLGLRTRRQIGCCLAEGMQFVIKGGIGGTQNYHSGSVARFWKGIDKYDWEILDRSIEAIIALNPDAKIIFYIGADAPHWWSQANPDERILLDGAKNPHPLSSPASQKLRTDVTKMLNDAITHMENSHYAGNIAGYRIVSQCDGGEFQYLGGWIGRIADFSPAMHVYFRNFLRKKYNGDLNALRQAWKSPQVTFENAAVPSKALRFRAENGVFRDYTGNSACVKDYIECQNECLASWAITLLESVKKAAPDKLIGLYGGYVLCYDAFQLLTNAHLGFGKIFDSGLPDYVSTPQDYTLRAPGAPNGCHIPHSSLKLRGIKLISEEDSRTHLGLRSTSTYSFNLDEDLQIMKRDFIWNLCNDGGIYFYDMAETWFTAPEMHRLIGKFQRIGNASLEFDVKPHNQVALLYSAESIPMLSLDSWALTHTVTKYLRENLGRSGVPYDSYLLNDIVRSDFPADNYRCFIIANGFALSREERSAISSKLCKDGKTVIFGYAPGAFVDNRIDLHAMTDLTGMEFTVSETPMALQMSCGGKIYGNMAKIKPAFRIRETDGVEILGRYVADNTPAFARKKFPEYTSVVSLVPQMSENKLRQILKDAGCHVYVDNGEAVFSNGRFVGIHAAFDGRKVIRLPRKSNVYDVFREREAGRDIDEIKVDMRKLESNLYFIGSAEEWNKFRKLMSK